MVSATPADDPVPALHGWTGPALLAAAALQFFLGDAILANFPARPMNLVGDIGLLLVMTSPLTAVAGLGEFGNWLVAHFRR